MSNARYIALLRGVNVGGKSPMKMAELRDCLESAGFTNVSTYIASGNVLFESPETISKVEIVVDKILEKRFDYRGSTVVLTATDFAKIIAEAPLGFGTKPDLYHSDVIFLKPPVRAADVINDIHIKEGVDTAAAGSKALYFTRLSAKRTSSRMSRIIELPSYKQMTIRSWNTAAKLAELLES